MVRCPFCGFESDESSFRSDRNPWRFRFYTVKRFQCPRCGGIFNYYSGISPAGKKSEFVIKVKPRIPRSR